MVCWAFERFVKIPYYTEQDALFLEKLNCHPSLRERFEMLLRVVEDRRRSESAVEASGLTFSPGRGVGGIAIACGIRKVSAEDEKPFFHRL
jgi:hypothetical protein